MANLTGITGHSAFRRPSPSRLRGLDSPTRKGSALLIATFVLVPLAVGGLISINPVYGVLLLVGLGVLWLARRSIVYPVVLAGIPSIFIGLYGSNPLPGKVIFASLTLWLVIGLGFAFMSGAWPSSITARRLVAPPILLVAGLTVLAIARLDPGAYPKTKVELFLAQGLPLLAAGIMIAFNARTLRLYLFVALAMAAGNAAVLTHQLSANQASQVFTARFSIATTYNPIWAGREAAIGVMIAIALILASRSARSSLLAYAAMPLLGVALISSGSRGPFIALLAAVCVLIALTLQDSHTRARLVRVGSGVVGAVVLIAAIVPGDAVNRSASFLFGNTSDLASNGRTHLWGQALRLFESHFWSGIGTGGFATIEPIARYPHNIVLESGAELGVLGASLMIAFLWLSLRTAFAAWSLTTDREGRIVAALVVALLVAAVVNAMLSDALETTDTLCLVVGLAYGLRARLADQAAEAHRHPAPRPAS